MCYLKLPIICPSPARPVKGRAGTAIKLGFDPQELKIFSGGAGICPWISSFRKKNHAHLRGLEGDLNVATLHRQVEARLLVLYEVEGHLREALGLRGPGLKVQGAALEVLCWTTINMCSTASWEPQSKA